MARSHQPRQEDRPDRLTTVEVQLANLKIDVAAVKLEIEHRFQDGIKRFTGLDQSVGEIKGLVLKLQGAWRVVAWFAGIAGTICGLVAGIVGPDLLNGVFTK